jgi:hypothetical protein
MMKITDINGFDLEIEDLQLAILQADDYRHYRHFNPQNEQTDEQRKAYWEDVYQKLLTLEL